MHAAIVAAWRTFQLGLGPQDIACLDSPQSIITKKIMDPDTADQSLNSVLTNSQVVVNLPPNDDSTMRLLNRQKLPFPAFQPSWGRKTSLAKVPRKISAPGGSVLPDQVGSQQQQSVLIIDHSADTRQVLRTALERRGWLIFEAKRAETGLKLARQHHPALVVLDLETIPAGEEAVRERLDSETENSRIPLVVLGNVRRSEALLPHQSVVQKPYHYGPLIRKIELLLADSEQAA